MAGWIKMPLGMKVGLDQSDIVLHGDPAPLLPKEGRGPQFSVHVCCGQTAAWIKIPLGMEVGLDPSKIALDGDPALPVPRKGAEPPNFWPMFVGCVKMPHGTMVGLAPGNIVLDADLAPPLPAPKFWPMSVVAKWLDGSRCHLMQR